MGNPQFRVHDSQAHSINQYKKMEDQGTKMQPGHLI